MSKNITPTQKRLLQGFDKLVSSIENENTVNVTETPQEKKKRIAKLLSNYEDFGKYYLPHYFKAPAAKFHKDFVNFVRKNKTCFVAVEWARDHAKSVTGCLALPLFLIASNDVENTLVVSKSLDNATELLEPLQYELEHNVRFINDFGVQKGLGNWSAGDFTTQNGVSFKAVGRGQSPRGTRKKASRPDLIIFDDIDDDEIVHNKARVEKLWDWVLGSLYATFSIKGGRFIGLQNNWAENSIMNLTVKKAHELKAAGHNVYHKKINILDKNGEPSWSERFTKAECKNMIDALGYILSQREYFNNPINAGKHFKPDYIQYKSMRSLKKYPVIISYCDPSFSDKGDSKAIVLAGYLPPNQYHIIMVRCGVATINDMIKWHYEINDFCTRHNISVKHFMEDVFWQKNNMMQYYHTYATKNKLPMLAIIGDKRKKPNKTQRILALTSFFESGMMYLNEHEKDNRHVKNLESQFLAFNPPKKTLVDGPDAVEGAIHILKNSILDIASSIKIGKRKSNKKYHI